LKEDVRPASVTKLPPAMPTGFAARWFLLPMRKVTGIVNNQSWTTQ